MEFSNLAKMHRKRFAPEEKKTSKAVTSRGVYMISGRLLHRREFTPVPPLSSVFVYMIPPKNVILGRLTPVRDHSGCCTGAKISLRREISQRYHANVERPLLPL